LIQKAHWTAIGFATVEEIDELNILQASLLAMKRAIENLERQMGQKAGRVVIDGNFKIPNLDRPQTTLVKGDLRCAPISAASIVAKVARDQVMKDLGVQYPSYGFESHKGYASPNHREAIEKWGPCQVHRKTFAGVKEWLHLANL
jgi:ribonuclease HII